MLFSSQETREIVEYMISRLGIKKAKWTVQQKALVSPSVSIGDFSYSFTYGDPDYLYKVNLFKVNDKGRLTKRVGRAWYLFDKRLADLKKYTAITGSRAMKERADVLTFVSAHEPSSSSQGSLSLVDQTSDD